MKCPVCGSEERKTYTNPCGAITICNDCKYVLDVSSDRETARILDELTKAYYKTEEEEVCK